MTAVVAEDVRRTYGDTVALDGVSLTLEVGEVFALVGPNGAGKTTLVRALTGTTEIEGSVSVFGESPRRVDRHRLGVLPQSFSPHARLTGRELLRYYAGLYDDARDVDTVLSEVGMTDDADTWYERLSGGQKRRLCVGTTLVNDPDLLVLDEPTTGIDPAGRRALWTVVEDLAAGGVTVLVTTHSMEEAQHLGDRVGVLADGSLVAVDAPAALIDRYGSEPVLEVEGAFDDRTLDALDRPARLADGTLQFVDVDPTDIGDVVADLEAAGVTYDGLSWREPTLEDVYLAITGKNLAGGEA